MSKIKQKNSTSIELVNPKETKELTQHEQIVYGVVAYTKRLATDGLYISQEALKYMSQQFLIDYAKGRAGIDIFHDNEKINAYLYESFMTNDNPPKGLPANAWIAGVYVENQNAWKKVVSGEINAFSAEFLAFIDEVEVEYETPIVLTGTTEKAFEGEHVHNYIVIIDPNNGQIVSGSTTEDNGHKHEINGFSHVDKADNHTHRFFTTY